LSIRFHLILMHDDMYCGPHYNTKITHNMPTIFTMNNVDNQQEESE
jgi:hypothetical protein